MQLPEAFTEEMEKLLGEEYPAWLRNYDSDAEKTDAVRGLRVNTLKIPVSDFKELFPVSLRPVPWTQNGFRAPGGERLSRHPYYAAGLYYLQEPSAMTPAAALPIEEGDRVLDLCAAPGGKATELAAKLKGTGLLVANDISNSRAKALLKNLELFGAGNILVTSESPERLTTYFEGWFDKILVDAPCSGEGMFRKEPSMIQDWLEKGPSCYSRIQKDIVRQAARLLRPGGLLLYSTCTFSVRENEETLLELLRSEPGFRLLPLPLPASFQELGFAPGRPELVSCEASGGGLSEEEEEYLRLAARLYPHRLEGEGHFVALLQKKGEPLSDSHERREEGFSGKGEGSFEGKQLPMEWLDFAQTLSFSAEKERFRLYDGKLYLLPEALCGRNIRGLRFLRTGLYLGEVRQKRFEPSQALAMYLRSSQVKNCLDLKPEDGRVLRYLKGETLDVSDLTAASECPADIQTKKDKKKKGRGSQDGWRLVCVGGFPLGWGKLSGDGTLKNKYYPGWRWQGAS